MVASCMARSVGKGGRSGVSAHCTRAQHENKVHGEPALAVSTGGGGGGEIRGGMRGVRESDAGAVVADRVAEKDYLSLSRNLPLVRIAKRSPELVVHFGGCEGEVGASKGVTYS